HRNSSRGAAMEMQRHACGGLLDAVQRLSSGTVSRLWIVTRGAQACGDNGSVNPDQATVWGLARTIAAEYPHFRCACVDLDPSCEPADDRALVAELRNDLREDQIAYRAGRRHVLRLAPLRSAMSSPTTPPNEPFELEIA